MFNIKRLRHHFRSIKVQVDRSHRLLLAGVWAAAPLVAGLAVWLEESARMQFLASQLGEPQEIDRTGKEDVFRGAFTHFQEVFWNHHSRQPEGVPYLRSQIF